MAKKQVTKTANEADRKWLMGKTKAQIVKINLREYKERYDKGKIDGDAANVEATTTLITEKCGLVIGTTEAAKGVFRKNMTLGQLIADYNKTKESLEDAWKQTSELNKLCLSEHNKLAASENECHRLQNIISNREYKLECYRTVMADTHDNIKLNPEVLTAPKPVGD